MSFVYMSFMEEWGLNAGRSGFVATIHTGLKTDETAGGPGKRALMSSVLQRNASKVPSGPCAEPCQVISQKPWWGFHQDVTMPKVAEETTPTIPARWYVVRVPGTFLVDIRMRQTRCTSKRTPGLWSRLLTVTFPYWPSVIASVKLDNNQPQWMVVAKMQWMSSGQCSMWLRGDIQEMVVPFSPTPLFLVIEDSLAMLLSRVSWLMKCSLKPSSWH